jgi:nucleoside-diphosphate-sugar epimerase
VRVLVTGGTGFTGRVLLRELAGRGDTVYALARPGSTVPDGVELLEQDLTAPLDGLPEAIDSVVHLAQSRRYREFPEGAADVFEVNANATVRLLDWARAAGAEAFVYASSGAVYAPGPDPAREIDTPDPGNFYAASKLAGELACEQFRGQLRAHVLRFFFIYGPGQGGMFIPGILGRIRARDAVALAGDDGIRVNPVFVDDAVRAVIGALEAPEPLTLNVAGPDVVSLRELAQLAGELLGVEPRFTTGDPRPDVVASIDLLQAAGLGAEVSFADGLRRTVAAAVAAS